MPKGQSPASLMKARYEMLDAQLDRMPKDYSKLSAFRRKVKEMLGTDDGQLVTSSQRVSLLKKAKKIEANMLRQDRMAEKVKKDQEP